MAIVSDGILSPMLVSIGRNAAREAPRTEGAISNEAAVRTGLEANLARLWRYAFVLSRARDVADDLVQQTCLRALERCAQFVAGSALDSWLFSILHSIWLNDVRARRVRLGQGFVDAQDSLVFDGAQQAETHILANQVLHQVTDLPEAQRVTVFLAYVEGKPYREVAAILDIPIGTVMSRLAAARARLAAQMAGGV